MKSLTYYLDIEEDNSLLIEFRCDGIQVIKETIIPFTDGSYKTQYQVRLPDGGEGYFVPTSRAAILRQKQAGRFLPPWGWVQIKSAMNR